MESEEEYPNIDAGGNGDWIKRRQRARHPSHRHQVSLSKARAMASGWHFAKESLTSAEHEMLLIIEELLREVDSLGGRGYAHVWPSEEKSETLKEI